MVNRPSSPRGADPKAQAILFGYTEMDKLLAEFLALEDTLLILSSALSQQPNPQAGGIYYRPRDAAELLRLLDVHPLQLLPVMANQYSARFASDALANRAREVLSSIRYGGECVLDFERSPESTIFFGVGVRHRVPGNAQLQIELPSPRVIPFHDIFYEVPHTKSGVHHPDSVLWFRTGQHQVHEGKVSILDVLPTILDYYDVPIPPDGNLKRWGRSLLPLLATGRYASPRRLAKSA